MSVSSLSVFLLRKATRFTLVQETSMLEKKQCEYIIQKNYMECSCILMKFI